MKHELKNSKTFRVFDNNSWTLFAVLLFTINLIFSNNHYANTNTKVTDHSISSLKLATTPSPIQANELINKELWNTLFPYRFGAKDTGSGVWVLNPEDDFYTFESFIEAINRMSTITATFERRCGTNAYRVTRTDEVTGVSKVIRTDTDFDAPINIDKEIVVEVVDYGSFLEEGDLEARKREITAFFANIAHETTGGWPTAPGGRFSWGLHFREEATTSSYASPDTNYPPTPGKSYKGRGPMQLSYNYNYGPASEFIFGDKQILLDNPERVIEDAALAFQTAIWFWMTPQYPKPSAHDVMVRNWIPRDLDLTKNRISGLGMTVNIINGGVECGTGTEKPQVEDRIGYYQRFTEIYNIGTDMDGIHDLSDCGCKDMTPYGGDATDLTVEPCALKPEIAFSGPRNNQIIKQLAFSTISITLSIDEKDTQLSTITTTIEGQTFNGTSFNWTPNRYGSHTLTANATFQNGATDTTTIKIVIWDGGSLNCQEVQEWSASVIYRDKDNYIKYNNKVYRNRWYADSNNIPGSDEVWEFVTDCTNSSNVFPVVSWQSPANGLVIEQTQLSPISLQATATDSDGAIQSFYFKQNNTTINATANGSSYTANFNPQAFGQYSIISSATDDKGATTESTVTFTIKEKAIEINTPPSISNIEPRNSEIVEQQELSPISLSATITDDKEVNSVTYIVNNIEISATKNGDSYTTNWTPQAFGNVTFTIRATDNENESSEITIIFTVKEKDTIGGDCNGISAWNPNQIYDTKGTQVSYNGKIYQNEWWTQNETPGNTDSWKFISNCDDTGNDFCGLNEWIATLAYNSGEQVFYDQKVYQAKWWTLNNIPDVSNEWEYVSDCINPSAKSVQFFKIFPTTVSDRINFSVQNSQTSAILVKLYDLTGKLINTQFYNKGQKGISQIMTYDVSNLKQGIYIFKIQVGNQIPHVEKILKK